MVNPEIIYKDQMCPICESKAQKVRNVDPINYLDSRYTVNCSTCSSIGVYLISENALRFASSENIKNLSEEFKQLLLGDSEVPEAYWDDQLNQLVVRSFLSPLYKK